MTRRNRPFVRVLPVAVAALSLLAAGCGGGGSPGVAGSAGSAGTTTIVYGTSGASAAALAFARCLRSHGIAAWPDPEPDGSFDKGKLRQRGIDFARVRGVEDRYCHADFESPGQAQAIPAAARVDYLEAAACMRRHGFPGFPDPSFPGHSVAVHIPASIDQSSARFKSAATTCTKLIPAGLPYSRRNGS